MAPIGGGYQETAVIADGPEVLDAGDVVKGVVGDGLATGSSSCLWVYSRDHLSDRFHEQITNPPSAALFRV